MKALLIGLLWCAILIASGCRPLYSDLPSHTQGPQADPQGHLDPFIEDLPLITNTDPNLSLQMLQSFRAHLIRMDEPDIAQRRADILEAYRFLWLRAFHRPVSIRVERTEETYSMFAKELDGEYGCTDCLLRTDRTRALSNAEWAAVKRRISHAKFWTMPVRDEAMGNDGADWVLEGYLSGQYAIVYRWSPDEQGSNAQFRDVCTYLLQLAKVDFGRVY